MPENRYKLTPPPPPRAGLLGPFVRPGGGAMSEEFERKQEKLRAAAAKPHALYPGGPLVVETGATRPVKIGEAGLIRRAEEQQRREAAAAGLEMAKRVAAQAREELDRRKREEERHPLAGRRPADLPMSQPVRPPPERRHPFPPRDPRSPVIPGAILPEMMQPPYVVTGLHMPYVSPEIIGGYPGFPKGYRPLSAESAPVPPAPRIPAPRGLFERWSKEGVRKAGQPEPSELGIPDPGTAGGRYFPPGGVGPAPPDIWADPYGQYLKERFHVGEPPPPPPPYEPEHIKTEEEARRVFPQEPGESRERWLDRVGLGYLAGPGGRPLQGPPTTAEEYEAAYLRMGLPPEQARRWAIKAAGYPTPPPPPKPMRPPEAYRRFPKPYIPPGYWYNRNTGEVLPQPQMERGARGPLGGVGVVGPAGPGEVTGRPPAAPPSAPRGAKEPMPGARWDPGRWGWVLPGGGFLGETHVQRPPHPSEITLPRTPYEEPPGEPLLQPEPEPEPSTYPPGYWQALTEQEIAQHEATAAQAAALAKIELAELLEKIATVRAVRETFERYPGTTAPGVLVSWLYRLRDLKARLRKVAAAFEPFSDEAIAVEDALGQASETEMATERRAGAAAKGVQ